jgi:hypothetical protein
MTKDLVLRIKRAWEGRIDAQPSLQVRRRCYRVLTSASGAKQIRIIAGAVAMDTSITHKRLVDMYAKLSAILTFILPG